MGSEGVNGEVRGNSGKVKSKMQQLEEQKSTIRMNSEFGFPPVACSSTSFAALCSKNCYEGDSATTLQQQ